MTHIHETAVVSHDARLRVNVAIGPFAVLAPCVALDAGCQIAAHGGIKSGTSLGGNVGVGWRALPGAH